MKCTCPKRADERDRVVRTVARDRQCPAHGDPPDAMDGKPPHEIVQAAARFHYLQRIDPIVAQAYFFNYRKPRDRALAIDADMTGGKS